MDDHFDPFHRASCDQCLSLEMKFIAQIRPYTLERQVEALQLQFDAPDFMAACNIGRVLLHKVEIENKKHLLADIWWAPELQGIHSRN